MKPIKPTEPIFYTATMGRIYLDQGRLDQAEAVYRHLLEKTPDSADFQEALDEIARRRGRDASGRLADLVGRWIELVRTERRLSDLGRINANR